MRGVRGMMPLPRRALAVGSLPVRSLVMLASVVVLLITGLLGMHVPEGIAGGHSTGHGRVAIGAPVEHAAGSAATHAHAAEAAPASTAASCTGDCLDSAPLAPGHAELMACVLALLAGLILLVPPGRAGRSWIRPVALAVRTDASAVLLMPPPRSLTLLSISRT